MEMLRETFFMKGFITAMVIAVLTKVIVWANYHRLLVSSEEMERPKPKSVRFILRLLISLFCSISIRMHKFRKQKMLS